jgi:hypothetical protein
MALGLAQPQARFESPRQLLGDRLREGSVYRLLADEGARIFPDDYFADLYSGSARGRPTVPARVLATARVLQAFEGLSDREACDRLEVDLRWQAAAGLHTGAESFHPTVLPGQRNRLRASARPRRLFEDTRAVANQAGAMAQRVRVLDSTPLYDAVATQDTVTQLRAAIRKLLVVLNTLHPALAAAVRGALLLALVAGQDVAQGDDGKFRIAKKVAKDRTISTVDPEARHGHKSANRHFDGYKTHLGIDPESELIDEVGQRPDADAVTDLLANHADDTDKPEVIGDSGYGSAATRSGLQDQGYPVTAKAAPVRNSTGGFTKEDFAVDLDAGAVTCPAGHTAPVRFGRTDEGKASFKGHCRHCPLREQCTPSRRGRTISVHPQEALLRRARAEQKSPEWQARYKSTRPIVERKVAHFSRRPWGGRKARVRGTKRVTTDVLTRAAALNWARLATLGLVFGDRGWSLS